MYTSRSDALSNYRLESEISEVLGDKSFVGEEDLEKMHYTEQVKLLYIIL